MVKHLDTLSAKFSVSYEFELAKSKLYSATTEVLSSNTLPECLERLGGQDNYLKENNKSAPMFIVLKKKDSKVSKKDMVFICLVSYCYYIITYLIFD